MAKKQAEKDWFNGHTVKQLYQQANANKQTNKNLYN